MKRLALASSFAFATAFTASAQTNTYPFPASGSVGIGTTTPGPYRLSVYQYPGYGGGYGIQSTAGYSDTAGERRNYTLNAGSGDWWSMGIRGNGGFALDYLDPNGGGAAKSNVFAINPDGNVGLGTTNPTQKLTVQGNALFGDGNRGSMIGHDSNNGGRAFLVLDKNSQNGTASGSDYVYLAQEGSQAVLVSALGTPLNLGSGSPNVSIATSGNVGIGTTSPTEKLSIGEGNVAENLRIGLWAFVGQEYNSLTTVLGGNAKSSGSTTVVAQTTVDGYRAIRMQYNQGILFHAYQGNVTAGQPIAHERMRITPTGNVGIGETNPSHKLAVNGTIKAKEVIVETTGWSDYVFADGYALQPLAEVEAHIKTNKHLPGIPSAAEVAAQGVSLGDMQARLLAKIEELTLHQIAQEKELAALRQEVRSLRENAGK